MYVNKEGWRRKKLYIREKGFDFGDIPSFTSLECICVEKCFIFQERSCHLLPDVVYVFLVKFIGILMPLSFHDNLTVEGLFFRSSSTSFKASEYVKAFTLKNNVHL